MMLRFVLKYSSKKKKRREGEGGHFEIEHMWQTWTVVEAERWVYRYSFTLCFCVCSEIFKMKSWNKIIVFIEEKYNTNHV